MGTVIVILILVVAVGLLAGKAKLNKTYDIPQQARALTIPSDAASVARGRHFAWSIAQCIDCHGTDLGGHVFLDVPPFRIVAANLTRGAGGIGSTFSDTDFVRAIRHGVAPDGHGLLVMPADSYTHLSDRDLADIIAYVRSVPPVDRQLPGDDIRPLGLLLLAANQLPPPPAATIDHSAQSPAEMPGEVSIQYGRYLASVGCVGCHGADLSGGRIPGLTLAAPPAQNITPAGIGTGLKRTSFTRFGSVNARTGPPSIA